jgi:pimeloyl-ACP methyl ester carboxylesterase
MGPRDHAEPSPTPRVERSVELGIDRRKLMALGAGTAAAAAGAGLGAAVSGGSVSAAAASAVPSSADLARSLSGGFSSRFAVANGIRQHYVIGGRGEPLVLLHGWPQMWWEYHKIMPALAQRYRVIAVDLRGGGDTDTPASGFDKKTMARDIRELIRVLGFSSVNIAGHDIGSMVAYSFAANHPEATRKVALLDVLHPNPSYFDFRLLKAPGQPFYPWWFAFNQVPELPEQLVSGRSRILVDWMFDNLLVNRAAINDFDRSVYAAAYSRPEGIRGGNGWYQTFVQDIADLATYAPITPPVLGMAHDLFFPGMAAQLPTMATNVTLRQVANTGHYFVEEQPQAVINEFTAFFG